MCSDDAGGVKIGPSQWEGGGVTSSFEHGNKEGNDYVYSLASANLDQSVPNLATIHMPMRARMSSIMGQIEPEHPELLALEFGKIAESDFVYNLASTNINQSVPNLVKMYMFIRSGMRLIMDLIRQKLSYLPLN